MLHFLRSLIFHFIFALGKDYLACDLNLEIALKFLPVTCKMIKGMVLRVMFRSGMLEYCLVDIFVSYHHPIMFHFFSCFLSYCVFILFIYFL